MQVEVSQLNQIEAVVLRLLHHTLQFSDAEYNMFASHVLISV